MLAAVSAPWLSLRRLGAKECEQESLPSIETDLLGLLDWAPKKSQFVDWIWLVAFHGFSMFSTYVMFPFLN